MRHLRFMGVRSVGAVVAAAALVCGLTVTTAFAATAGHTARPAVLPTVTWHKLTLLNGWKSARSTTYPVADPAYAVSGGIVYLNGALTQLPGTNTNKKFAVLPSGARPVHKLYLTVLSGGGNGTPGTVEITSNGVMTASSPSGSTRQVTLLDAVSYPAAGATWHTMSLQNGWHSGATAFGTGNPAYAVKNGIAYLAGSLFTHGSSLAAVTHLGTTARPLSVVYISVYIHGGGAGSVEVFPNGTVLVHGTTTASQTALDGVSYPTSAAHLSWHKFALNPGWSSSQGAYQTGDPEYAVRGPIVYLSGSMNSSGITPYFTNLPSAGLSTHELIRQLYTAGIHTGVLILTTGSGSASGIVGSTPVSTAESFTSLAGIAFPGNS